MIDWKYLNTIKLIGPFLPGFKATGKYLWNFRCNICGDSKRDKTKTRAYFFCVDDKILFKCHNCTVSMSFEKYVEEYFPEYFSEFQFAKYRPAKEPVVPPPQPPKYKVDLDFRKFKSIAVPILELPEDHPCRRYVDGRKLPEAAYERLWWIDDIVNLEHPKLLKYHEGRLAIPAFHPDKTLQGMTLRDITGLAQRKYIAMKLDDADDSPMIFGIEKLSKDRQAYITEGAIDSMFFENGFAVGGSSFEAASKFFEKSKTTLIFDNQPRNKAVVKNYKSFAEQGWRLYVPPKDFDPKDVNQMVIDGVLKADDVKDFINENSYTGLRLTLAITHWLS